MTYGLCIHLTTWVSFKVGKRGHPILIISLAVYINLLLQLSIDID